jgi:hypothetical protein
MPRHFIIAGFDYGTSYSKVVLREQNTGRSVVVKFNGFPDGLLPSLIGFDGRNLLPPSLNHHSSQIPYLKMLAAHAAFGTPVSSLPFRFPTPIQNLINDHGLALIRDLISFYFAHVIAGVRHFIKTASPWDDFDFTPGNAQDYLIFQMAVPTGLLADGGRAEKLFREALIVANELYADIDPKLTTSIPLNVWADRTNAVPLPLLAEGQDKYKWQCTIYPEVAAAVQTVFRLDSAPDDARFIIMDVGAGTVDLNVFYRNRRGRRVDYYAALVEPLGAHHLTDEFNAIQSLGMNELKAKLRIAVANLFRRAVQYQPNHGAVHGHRTWDRAHFFISGGGAHLPTYRRSFTDGLRDVGIHLPTLLNLPAPLHFETPPETEFGRFAVAYGMSFFKPNLDRVKLPHELYTFAQLYPPTDGPPAAYGINWED